MSPKIITLLTDFGMEDAYVASMKGVILTLCPEAVLVDISHFTPPQDVRSGAFLLSTAFREFPAGTVHLAVVDPGVGTARKAIAIRTPRYFFVGPDNGLFSWVLSQDDKVEVRCLENPQYWRPTVSATFHGRDLFAPVAAHLAMGVPIDRLGPPCDPMRAEWSTPILDAEGVHGEVIHVDHFGNAITNLDRETLMSFAAMDLWTVDCGGASIHPVVAAYGELGKGEILALIGSSERLEIAVNQGSAAKALGIHTGDRVSVHRRDAP